MSAVKIEDDPSRNALVGLRNRQQEEFFSPKPAEEKDNKGSSDGDAAAADDSRSRSRCGPNGKDCVHNVVVNIKIDNKRGSVCRTCNPDGKDDGSKDKDAEPNGKDEDKGKDKDKEEKEEEDIIDDIIDEKENDEDKEEDKKEEKREDEEKEKKDEGEKYCPWNPLKANPRGQQSHPANKYWGMLMYRAMVGNPAIKESDGGVNHIASWGRLNGPTINKEQADWLCGNPCWWYYKKQPAGSKWRTSMDKISMCDCSGSKAKAENWCEGSSGVK